ncbi:MAG: hypothetical protein O3A10_09785 [Chloroflexi bacterium]|nr:hypothetical protein [Chloroflexota bacterium]MDA1147970.1 hypothetical protein [Chloroflexota bacterium]
MFRFGIGAFVFASGLLATVACGGAGDDGAANGTTTLEAPAATGQSAPDEVEVDFVLSDFAIDGPESVSAGLVRFNVANEGAAIHELVIVRTDAEPAALPIEGGVVAETELDVVGEIEEFPGGETRSATFELSAGRYLLICNVPGHFLLGMVTEFSVT